jgi:hypothetical protein
MAEAGGAGHVDLGEVAVDDVDADERQSVGSKRRRHRLDDPAVVGIEVRGLDLAPDADVGPEVSARRAADDSVERSAVEQEDPLVARAHRDPTTSARWPRGHRRHRLTPAA